MWDFLTMECINTIDGPELTKKNVEISTICYLKRISLIAVGTDLGKIFFWDLNKSIYLKNDYENYFKHKSVVSCIVNSHNVGEKEYMFSAGHDGNILVWEIESVEIKEYKNTKREQDEDNQVDFEKLKETKRYRKKSTFEDALPMIDSKGPKQKLVYNFKYLPQIKASINTTSILNNLYNIEAELANKNFRRNSVVYNRIEIKQKENLIFVISYTKLTPDFLYSGGNDCFINIWNFKKGSHVNSLIGHKTTISCMTFDKNYLFSGSMDGQILIWNTYDQTHLMTLGESLISHIRILDIMMIPKFGILVSITNDKKVNFWKYETKELIKTVTLKNECLCLSIVESYGKLLSGTKDKTIIEIDLAEILGSLNIQHDYKKFHFVEKEINYQIDERDKNIDNFKIMKLLGKGIFN